MIYNDRSKPLRELPELVQDSELQVTIRDNITIHNEPLECRYEFSPQIWQYKRPVGRGGDGNVFLQHKIQGPGAVDTIAVKQMSLNADLASEDHDSKRYVRELEALAKFAQGRYARSFVRSYGWYQEEGWLYICMEYCKHLDLGKHLRIHGPLSEETARIITVQILQGLVQMHRNRIAHRDLKPANILIHRKPPEDDTWWVVLGDLGLSRRSDASSGTTTVRGTPSFMAPETIGSPFLGDPNSADAFRADMWCLGETVSRALTGHGTFSNHDQLLQYQKHCASFPDSDLKESGVSSDAIDFVRSLMDVDPLRRLTAPQALNHPWIKANHISHAYTASIGISGTLRNGGREASMTLKGSKKEPFDLENQSISRDNQPTQASAQWTRTLPVHSSNTQASQKQNTTVLYTELKGNSSESLYESAGSGRSLKPTTMHTKGTPVLGQVLNLSSSGNNKPNPSQDDQNSREAPTQRTSQLFEHDALDSFKRWSAADKLRIAEMQKEMARESNKLTLSDPKRFSELYKLASPIPTDLLPILSDDDEKTKRIEETQGEIEAPIKQETLIRDVDAEQMSSVAPKALQEAQEAPEHVVREPKRASLTPQRPWPLAIPKRSYASLASNNPWRDQGQSQSQSDVSSISDSESEEREESDTVSDSGATLSYWRPPDSHPRREVRPAALSVASHKHRRPKVRFVVDSVEVESWSGKNEERGSKRSKAEEDERANKAGRPKVRFIDSTEGKSRLTEDNMRNFDRIQVEEAKREREVRREKEEMRVKARREKARIEKARREKARGEKGPKGENKARRPGVDSGNAIEGEVVWVGRNFGRVSERSKSEQMTREMEAAKARWEKEAEERKRGTTNTRRR